MKFAVLAALFFVAFEGTFWKVGVTAWDGLTAANGTAVVLAVSFFALFVYYAAKQVVVSLPRDAA